MSDDIPAIPKSETGENLLKKHSAIAQMQALFALKITAKHGMSQETINEVISFSEDIHDIKMELILQQMEYRFDDDTPVPIQDIIENIKLVDNVTGMLYFTNYVQKFWIENWWN